MATKLLRYNGNEFKVKFEKLDEQDNLININENQINAKVQIINQNVLSIAHNNRLFVSYFAADKDKVHVSVNGERYTFEKVDKTGDQYGPGSDTVSDSGKLIRSPMPGKILKLFVKENQKITKGDPLFIIEAMKMENEVKASRNCQINKINFRESDLVSVGEAVIELKD